MQIEDGFTGRTARITKDGQLEAFCESNTSELLHSTTGNSYIVGNNMATMDGSESSVLYLKNASQISDIHVYSMLLSTDSPNFPQISIYKNQDYVSSGYLAEPVNLNMSFGDTAAASCYFGDSLVCSGTAANILGCYLKSGISKLDFGGSVILSYNDSLTWAVRGASNEHASIYVRFYYDN